MEKQNFSFPLSLRDVQVTDTFWKKEMELVRTEVIPYQWSALNDQVEGAAPSYCMHNFRAAGKLNQEKREQGSNFVEPVYTFRGFETLPDDPQHPEENRFYGFVFQDSDFYKWIEAVGYSLTQHPDPQLEAIADGAIDLVCAAQQEDGYLDTYYILNGKDRIFTNLRDNHELYCLGHLLEGAVAYYQATGKDKLLNAARRYADYVADYFGPEEGKCKGYPGHEIAEMALVRLYETTGDSKYLNLAKYFVDERGSRPYYFDKEHPEEVKKHPNGPRYAYNQAHVPVREQDEAVGHAVRAVYLYSGMADIARLTEDETLFAACQTLWDNMTRKKLYITGGIGGTHEGEAFSFNYDLPNDTAYAETCASIGLVFFARRMLEICPDSRYADVMEQALYNTVLSGMALDGKSFFYVNPLEVLPEACHKDSRKFHVKPVRQKWFGCACCPPNLARTISSVSSYAFTEKEDTLFVHLYVGSDLKKTVNGKEAAVHITSGFPWDGTVQVRAESADEPLTIAFRVPGWAEGCTAELTSGHGTTGYSAETTSEQSGKGYRVELTSKPVASSDPHCDICPDATSSRLSILGLAPGEFELRDGYLYITRIWKSGETLTLHFPMEVQIWQADPRVREDIGKVAVTRGPITYCLEEADNGANLHLLTLSPEAAATVEEAVVAGEPVRTILLPGFREVLPDADAEEAGSRLGLYRPASRPEKTPVTLRFIPYYTWANRGENEMAVWVRV